MTITGGQPLSSSLRASAPRRLIASSRSATGRCAHPGDAVEPEGAPADADHRREEPQGRARVADEQLGLLAREVPAAALDDDGRRGRVVLDGQAEPAEAVDHHPGVVAVEGPGQGAPSPGQAGDDEGPVRQALGTRHPDAGLGGRERGRRSVRRESRAWEGLGRTDVIACRPVAANRRGDRLDLAFTVP